MLVSPIASVTVPRAYCRKDYTGRPMSVQYALIDAPDNGAWYTPEGHRVLLANVHIYADGVSPRWYEEHVSDFSEEDVRWAVNHWGLTKEAPAPRCLTDHERLQRIRTAAAFPKQDYLRAALVEHTGMSDYTARAISGRVRSGYGLKDAVGETGADYVLSADPVGPVVDPSWPFADEITEGQRTIQNDIIAIDWLLGLLGAPPVS